LRALFAGSGSDALSVPEVSKEIISLSGKDKPAVLYLGTATYDLPEPRDRQTCNLAMAGCVVTSLDVARTSPPPDDMVAAVEAADVILVSGGNTLFACDRWVALGLNALIRDAMNRGAVLCGGSAGAACWFDACHSDSMDPDTYMSAKFNGGHAPGAVPREKGGDEASTHDPSDIKRWEYIRVPCLGLLPGLVCPHHDKTQSNGVLRAVDFDQMLMRHPGELGLCIDHWAALIVEGDNYRVFKVPDKEGSVKGGMFSAAREGVPGIWLKSVSGDGEVVATLAPTSGRLSELLRRATAVVEDTRVETCRRENPPLAL